MHEHGITECDRELARSLDLDDIVGRRVIAAYITGSRAINLATETSDLDIVAVTETGRTGEVFWVPGPEHPCHVELLTRADLNRWCEALAEWPLSVKMYSSVFEHAAPRSRLTRLYLGEPVRGEAELADLRSQIDTDRLRQLLVTFSSAMAAPSFRKVVGALAARNAVLAHECSLAAMRWVLNGLLAASHDFYQADKLITARWQRSGDWLPTQVREAALDAYFAPGLDWRGPQESTDRLVRNRLRVAAVLSAYTAVYGFRQAVTGVPADLLQGLPDDPLAPPHPTIPFSDACLVGSVSMSQLSYPSMMTWFGLLRSGDENALYDSVSRLVGRRLPPGSLDASIQTLAASGLVDSPRGMSGRHG